MVWEFWTATWVPFEVTAQGVAGALVAVRLQQGGKPPELVGVAGGPIDDLGQERRLGPSPLSTPVPGI